MQPKVTPKDFFLWVGAMVFLYGSVFAFISLLFEYINYAFPDPLSYTYFGVDAYSSGMRFAMASLIVLVPTTLILMRLIRKDIAQDALKSDLWIRRWALFLTVFIAGVSVVIDLITLVNYFLGGDLTTRFILKVLVVLLVAGGVFMHFLADIRGYWMRFPERARAVGWGAGGAVLVAIVAGFFIMGSPSEMRKHRFDEQKVGHLQEIQWQVVNFWQQKETVPTTLGELEDPISGWKTPLDPQSNQPYRYEKTGARSFKLCATFNADSRNTSFAPRVPMSPYVNGVENDNWLHGIGEVCFDRTIDPERYPPYPKGTGVKPVPVM